MNRYGEKAPPLVQSDDDGFGGVSSGRDQVMYGGCGVRFGSFQREVDRKKENPSRPWSLLDFLGIGRKIETKD